MTGKGASVRRTNVYDWNGSLQFDLAIREMELGWVDWSAEYPKTYGHWRNPHVLMEGPVFVTSNGSVRSDQVSFGS